MVKVEYTPQALKDLQNIKVYVAAEFGDDIAQKVIHEITKDIRRLELYPVSGQMLSGIIDIPTEYYYLYTKKNYVFYRLEQECVKVIRVINDKQDYMQILFQDEQ